MRHKKKKDVINHFAIWSAVLVFVIVGLVGSQPPTQVQVTKKLNLVNVWPGVVRGIFRINTAAPYLIVLLPEEGRTPGSDFPVLIVPAGPFGYDDITPFAFLQGDKLPPVIPKSVPATPTDDENGDDADEGNFEEDNDWPPVIVLEWPPGWGWPGIFIWPPFDIPPWPAPLDPDKVREEDINEMLDNALRRAFEDKESPPEEDEEEDSIKLRLWTPRIPPNLPQWRDPREVPDLPPLPDPLPDDNRSGKDFRIPGLPRWEDVDPGTLPPPGWPLNEPWPPKEGFRLPERWRPKENGFHLGNWRFYIVPLLPPGSS